MANVGNMRNMGMSSAARYHRRFPWTSISVAPIILALSGKITKRGSRRRPLPNTAGYFIGHSQSLLGSLTILAKVRFWTMFVVIPMGDLMDFEPRLQSLHG